MRSAGPRRPPDTLPTFRTKYDAWLVAVLLGSAAGAMALLAVTLEGSDRWAWLPFLALAAGVAWCADTRYAFTESELDIRSGPFRWRVPLAEVARVSPTRDPLSAPAWSLDRIVIQYRSTAGLRQIAISPEPRAAFLAALRARCPAASIEA